MPNATRRLITPSQHEIDAALRVSRPPLPPQDNELINEMRANRRVSARHARALQKTGLSSGGSDISFATGRPRDPMFYWRQNNLPYDVTKPEELVQIRALCRLLYLTHPLLASAIDIFSKFPLTGMEPQCKDKAITSFYEDLFFDETRGLNYEEFLIDIGREYWTVGEAWPFGSFNETLGVWEDDELLNPDDIDVIRSPFLKDPRFEMRLPKTIRDILQARDPKPEYEMLLRGYPELVNYSAQDARIPVSNVLLKQIKFKADTFHPRGLPLMMRGFRAIMQEEMLNAAQDAIADRLYTPLIVAKLGASAQDLGTNQPWIPTEDDVLNFEEALDAALAADFRVLVHHFALDIGPVFGRETMPNLDADFERLENKELQVFGLSKTMLAGAGQGETYAADALNRDLITQLLTTFQNRIKRFWHERCLVVAEAQEHYDYDERGGQRVPIMEEVLTVDEETGEQVIREQPKLLVPDLQIRSMNMRDEQTFRQLVEALRESGVPISMKTRLTNIPIDFDDEIERTHEEQVQLAIEAQRVRKDTYVQLKGEGLPIPDDLQADFGPTAMQRQDDGGAAAAADANGAAMNGQDPTANQTLPSVGVGVPSDTEALVPLQEGFPQYQVMGQDPFPDPQAVGNAGPNARPSTTPGNPVATTRRLPVNRARPPESDEARRGMPRPASLTRGPSHVGARMRTTKKQVEERLAKADTDGS